jgi:hypothetical protein
LTELFFFDAHSEGATATFKYCHLDGTKQSEHKQQTTDKTNTSHNIVNQNSTTIIIECLCVDLGRSIAAPPFGGVANFDNNNSSSSNNNNTNKYFVSMTLETEAD